MNKTEALRAKLLETSEHLDPQRQGLAWPDPIAWDGRSLEDQAHDTQALLDGKEEDERAAELSAALEVAVNEARAEIEAYVRAEYSYEDDDGRPIDPLTMVTIDGADDMIEDEYDNRARVGDWIISDDQHTNVVRHVDDQLVSVWNNAGMPEHPIGCDSDGVRLFVVDEGDVTEVSSADEVETDGTNSILVAASSEESALRVADAYDRGRVQADNLVWNGETIAAVALRYENGRLW